MIAAVKITTRQAAHGRRYAGILNDNGIVCLGDLLSSDFCSTGFANVVMAMPHPSGTAADGRWLIVIVER
jgi:hypothetical protein